MFYLSKEVEGANINKLKTCIIKTQNKYFIDKFEKYVKIIKEINIENFFSNKKKSS